MRAIRFMGLFILIFALAQALYYLIEPRIKPVYINILHTRVPCGIINAITPSQGTIAHGDTLISRRGSVVIGRGCDATGAMLLLIAGLGAFPMPFYRRVAGILLALGILYLTNIIRIICLFYVYVFRPELFNVVHVYGSQVFMIAIGWLFFLSWIRTCRYPP
jgi:exosortase family protein XrtM